MTLIVGLKCTDGVVIGADGAATLGNQSANTIRQTTRKLNVIPGKAVLGVSGHNGFSQIFTGALTEFLSQEQQLPSWQLISEVAQVFEGVAAPLITAASRAAPIYGRRKAIGGAATESLVAMSNAGELALIHIGQTFLPALATDDLPFFAIGSGEAIADPFLAFLKKVYFPNGRVSLVDGTFAVYWTLAHACQTHHAGVTEPLQLIQLSRDAGVAIRELGKDDLREHAGMMDAIETEMREFRRTFSGAPKVSLPPKPQREPEAGTNQTPR